MTNSETELDELKALQREAAELRSATRRKESTAELAEGQGSAASADAPAAAAPLEEATPESTAALEDVNVDLNAILKDMEDAARERPVLALLAAFSLGIVVGQMFSRR